MPRFLTVENKHNRAIASAADLAIFSRNVHEFLQWYLTILKTWIHYSRDTTKVQMGSFGRKYDS